MGRSAYLFIAQSCGEPTADDADDKVQQRYRPQRKSLLVCASAHPPAERGTMVRMFEGFVQGTRV